MQLVSSSAGVSKEPAVLNLGSLSALSFSSNSATQVPGPWKAQSLQYRTHVGLMQQCLITVRTGSISASAHPFCQGMLYSVFLGFPETKHSMFPLSTSTVPLRVLELYQAICGDKIRFGIVSSSKTDVSLVAGSTA